MVHLFLIGGIRKVVQTAAWASGRLRLATQIDRVVREDIKAGGPGELRVVVIAITDTQLTKMHKEHRQVFDDGKKMAEAFGHRGVN